MHEAGAVAAAIDEALAVWPSYGPDGPMTIEILDPTRAEEGAVGFYAEVLLEQRGFDRMRLSIQARSAECRLCGSVSSPTPVDPCCESCGAPIPRTPGPAITCYPSALVGPKTGVR